jgi:hypothetical protein
MDTYEIAAEIGSAQSFVVKMLKLSNVPRRSTYSYIRKYNVNEHFFDIINTEERAYFLGLMFADGNNYRRIEPGAACKYEVAIKLQARDRYILDRFKSFLCPNTTLKFIPRGEPQHQDVYLLKINSKIVSNQLISLGCIPNKSLILQYPVRSVLSANLDHHFIRGYVDGDGGIYNWKKEWKTTTNINWSSKMTSTKAFCEQVKRIVKDRIDIDMYLSTMHENSGNLITSDLGIGGNLQAHRFLSWLYRDATVYLPRKYDKFIKLCHNMATGGNIITK